MRAFVLHPRAAARERERDRGRDRQTDRDRKGERKRETETETETKTEGQARTGCQSLQIRAAAAGCRRATAATRAGAQVLVWAGLDPVRRSYLVRSGTGGPGRRPEPGYEDRNQGKRYDPGPGSRVQGAVCD
jgi:hypothetical protein